jgi:hypothetical protein
MGSLSIKLKVVIKTSPRRACHDDIDISTKILGIWYSMFPVTADAAFPTLA